VRIVTKALDHVGLLLFYSWIVSLC